MAAPFKLKIVKKNQTSDQEPGMPANPSIAPGADQLGGALAPGLAAPTAPAAPSQTKFKLKLKKQNAEEQQAGAAADVAVTQMPRGASTAGGRGKRAAPALHQQGKRLKLGQHAAGRGTGYNQQPVGRPGVAAQGAGPPPSQHPNQQEQQYRPPHVDGVPISGGLPRPSATSPAVRLALGQAAADHGSAHLPGPFPKSPRPPKLPKVMVQQPAVKRGPGRPKKSEQQKR
jgi:hypothetical protein